MFSRVSSSQCPDMACGALSKHGFQLMQGGVHPTHPDPARLKNIEISTKLDIVYR